MELRLLAPEDRERKWRGEAGNVQHLDNSESRRVEWVFLLDRELDNAYGGPGANDDDGDGESDTEPSEPAVHADIVRANQRGLQNEKQHPCGEHNGVDV